MPHKDREVRLQYLRDYHTRNRDTKLAQRRLVNVRRRLRLVFEAGLELRCARCGFDAHPAALAFHHKDPQTKLFEIDRENRIVRGRKYTRKQLIAEAQKCEMLCVCCYSIEHASYTSEDARTIWDEVRG